MNKHQRLLEAAKRREREYERARERSLDSGAEQGHTVDQSQLDPAELGALAKVMARVREREEQIEREHREHAALHAEIDGATVK